MKTIGVYAIYSVRLIGAFCSVLLITLFIANGEYTRFSDYCKANETSAHAQSKYLTPGSPWNFFENTVADTGAYWTAIASLVGMIALWGVNEQINASRKANNAANRSAKAAEVANTETVRSNDIAEKALTLTRKHEADAIERGRGTMAFWKLWYNPETFSFDYCFMNIGGGPVIITEITSGCAIIYRNTPVDHVIHGRLGYIYIPVPVGGYASTFEDGPIMEMIAGNGVAIPADVREFVGREGYEAAICIRLKYQARTEDVFVSQTLIRVSDFTGNNWAVDLGHPYTFECSNKMVYYDLFKSIGDINS
ncbi:MAG: hypothetical protein JNN32_04450 [Flavobacteriales bacterium]|nr:hypothetical protein [Flavobacteriales bacterium]